MRTAERAHFPKSRQRINSYDGCGRGARTQLIVDHQQPVTVFLHQLQFSNHLSYCGFFLYLLINEPLQQVVSLTGFIYSAMDMLTKLAVRKIKN